MNKFLIEKVIAACDQFLLTANSIYAKNDVNHAVMLRAYVKALQADGHGTVYLSIEDLAGIAIQYANLYTTSE